MNKIYQAIRNFFKWVKHWFYDVPTSEPPTEEKYRLRAFEVAKEYMIVTYHGQRINMLRIAYPAWKLSSRKDKRATRDKFEKQEKQGLIKFIEVDGHLICVANRDYAKRAEKAKLK